MTVAARLSLVVSALWALPCSNAEIKTFMRLVAQTMERALHCFVASLPVKRRLVRGNKLSLVTMCFIKDFKIHRCCVHLCL